MDLSRQSNDTNTDLLLAFSEEAVLHWGFVGKQVQHITC